MAWIAVGVIVIVVAAAASRPEAPTELVITIPEPTETNAPGVPAMTEDATRELTPADRKGAAYVSRAKLGDEWPLTVEEGRLRCKETEGFHAIFFNGGGRWYGVNGIARITTTNPKIDELLADDPENPGEKKSVSPLIELGLALCE